MSVRSQLVAGRDYLQAYGWNQGAYKHWKTGAVCAIGALAYGAFDGRTYEAEASEACRLLSEQVFKGGLLHRWNDFTGRTAAEVLALYDRAIAEAATQLQPED